MHLPSLAYVGKAILIALALFLLGYLILPAAITASVAALLVGASAFLGALLGASFGPSTTSAPAGDETPQTLFVGNLAFKTTEEELRQLFASQGQVSEVRIMRDRKTRRPRGYGFVQMPHSQALRAIRALNGKDFHGRTLRVKEGNRRESNDEQA